MDDFHTYHKLYYLRVSAIDIVLVDQLLLPKDQPR